jgi:hypothetical protein
LASAHPAAKRITGLCRVSGKLFARSLRQNPCLPEGLTP